MSLIALVEEFRGEESSLSYRQIKTYLLLLRSLKIHLYLLELEYDIQKGHRWRKVINLSIRLFRSIQMRAEEEVFCSALDGATKLKVQE